MLPQDDGGSLTRSTTPAVIRQGEQGDAYYLIAAGQFDVVQDGRLLRRCGRGEGVGEIALLHAVPGLYQGVSPQAITL